MGTRKDRLKAVLAPAEPRVPFTLTLHAPSGGLRHHVEHYWIVRWDLRGQTPHVQEVLPYPCVHLVLEARASLVWGVTRRKFTRVLEGKGMVFGVRFRPGAFRPFAGFSISKLTDRSIAASEVFGEAVGAVERRVLGSADARAMVAAVEPFLIGRLPTPDPQLEIVQRIVLRITDDASITRIDQLVEWSGLHARTLQRLFSEYVGVSPKWIVQRCRLQEAVAALERSVGREVSWAAMALDLGYFDQSHFIRDFRAVVGVTPTEYARRSSLLEPPARAAVADRRARTATAANR